MNENELNTSFEMEDHTEVESPAPSDFEEIPEISQEPACPDDGTKLLDNMEVEPETTEEFQVKEVEKPRFIPENYSFEQASQKLGEIINRLERGNSSLQESLDLYQEGKELVAFCQQEISYVKQQVVILRTSGADGAPEEHEFIRERKS